MKREAGFSLLEVLVALVILAIIGVAVSQTTSLTASVWRRTEGFPKQTEEALLRQHVRLWLETMKSPRSLIGLKSEPEGDQTQFQFITTTTPAIAPELTEARITLFSDVQEGRVLIEFVSRDGKAAYQERRDLIDAPLVLKYFDAIEGSWRDEWTDKERLPGLISIEVGDRAATPWPPLIVAPLIDQRF